MKTLIVLALLLATAVPALALQATVNWTNPADPNRTGLRVERQDAGAGAFVVQGSVLGASVTVFNQAGLILNTQYCYRVIAQGALGDAPQPWPTLCGTPNSPVNVNGITIIFAP